MSNNPIYPFGGPEGWNPPESVFLVRQGSHQSPRPQSTAQPLNQEGTSVDPPLTSSTRARPDYHHENPSLLSSSRAGGPQQSSGAAPSGQILRSSSAKFKDLQMWGMALQERLIAGETLTAAESQQLVTIKNIIQRLKDQSTQVQKAQNSSLHEGQPQQVNSPASSVPPQHVQSPEMIFEDIRTRFAHLQEKHRSQGLTAAESRENRALYAYLRQLYPGRQQGDLPAGGNHASSSQNQATIPGRTPSVNVTALSTVSPSVDGNGQPPEAQSINVRYNSAQGHISNQTVDPPAQQHQRVAPLEQQHHGHVRQQSYNNVQGQFGSSQPQLQDMFHQGHLQPRAQAMAQTSAFQAGIMPQPQNTSLAQGISRHQSDPPSHHSRPEYQRFAARGALPMIAGEKHGLYNKHVQDGNEVQDRAKRPRVTVPLDTNYSAGQAQAQPALEQTSHSGSDTTRLQEQPKIIIPLGNLDPKVAQETLGTAIKITETGGKLTRVPPGSKAIIVPEGSFIACRPQDSPSIYIGSSDTPDIQHSQTKIAYPSFLQGLKASMEHQRKIEAGVPFENIKMAVFDDRQHRVEPISKPEQSSAVTADAGESTHDTAIKREQGAATSEEEADVKEPASEDAKMMATAHTQSPGATAGVKRSLSAVQEGLGPAGDLDQAAKRPATGTPNDGSMAADDCQQVEQATSPPTTITPVLPSLDQTARQSSVVSSEDQPSIPRVSAEEEAREQYWDAIVAEGIEDWNARPKPTREEPDRLKEWREKHKWQDTDDEEEDS